MSIAHTTSSPAAPAAGEARRTSLLRWIAGGVLTAVILAAVAITVWPGELDIALDDLSSQASDFRAQGPEVHQAYWEGVNDGLAKG